MRKKKDGGRGKVEREEIKKVVLLMERKFIIFLSPLASRFFLVPRLCILYTA